MLTRTKKKFNVEVLRDLLNEQLTDLEIDKEDPDSDYAHVESCRDMSQSLLELKVIRTHENDWAALYAGDSIIFQGHRVEYKHLADYMGIQVKQFRIGDDDMDSLGTKFPNKFSEIPYEYLVY